MTLSYKPNLKLAVGIPIGIFFACYLITFSSVFKTNQGVLSNAIILDLIITAPLAYLFFIRKTSISKITVSRIFILGLLVAGWILNAKSNSLLYVLKIWISPLVESTVIFFVVRKFYLANKQAKLENKNNVDFLFHCRKVMFQILGNEKIGNLISSEISVLYYTFARNKNKKIDYKTKFTSYKENSILLLLGMILFVFFIELFASHLIISHWNKTIAWIISGLSFYTCLQVIAHMKAIKARPIVINSDSFEIHNGLAGDALIEFDNIDKIELSNKFPERKGFVKIALLKGLEAHNMIAYLKQPIEVTKIFGIKKKTAVVLFSVDKSKEFLALMKQKLPYI